MAANFRPAPPLPPVIHRLAPALIPPPIGIGVGAGQLSVSGVAAQLTSGQGLNARAGQLVLSGAPVQLSVGVVAGFNTGAAQITWFGNTVGVGINTGLTPSQTATPDNVAFAPALSELAIDAWERVGKSPGELTVQHLNSMRRSMNLVLGRWSNRGINLWSVTQNSLTLTQGVATYSLPANLIDMLDTYLSTTDGTAITTDIVLTPMGRDTYAALPQKAQQGRPILYWFDRTIASTVTLWPVPDQTYALPYFAFTQTADLDPTGGNKPGLPYRFLEAFTAAVAAHLAQKWSDPQRAMALDAYAKETWAEASAEDREKTTFSLVPNWSGLWR